MAFRDWLLWAVLSALMAFENILLGHSSTKWAWIAVIALAFWVVVRFRRTRPLVALAGSFAVTSGVLLKSITVGGGFTIVHIGVLVLTSYLVGRHSRGTRAFVVMVVATDVLLGVVGVSLRGPTLLADAIMTWFFLLLATLVLVVLPWLLGRHREQRSRLALAGWERAERVEAQQRMALAQARLRERNRIAQDMHDSLGHELSLIALRAAALEVSGGLAADDRAAVAELRVSAAHATASLGEIVGVLRAGEGAASVQPAVESVAEVVGRAADSGMTVELREAGPPRPLPSLVQQAVVRVVREALTNVAKHRPGSSSTVTMSFEATELAIQVANGSATRSGAVVVSGGNGLAALTERVRLIGGSLTAGSTGEGFVLEARVPYEVAIATQSDTEARADSAAELAAVRGRARRGLVTAIAAPAALGAGLGLLMLLYYVVVGHFSAMDRADYEAVQVGQHRADIEGRLPALQMVDAPTVDRPAALADAACEFYRAGQAFTTTFVYRLCFDDDVLVAKDRVRSGTAQIEEAP